MVDKRLSYNQRAYAPASLPRERPAYISAADWDMLCCHIVQGESYNEIATHYPVKVEAVRGRINWALVQIDRQGDLRKTSLGRVALRVYVADFPGVYLGGHAVILAHSEDEAREMLVPELSANGLPNLDVAIRQIADHGVYVLDNGDY